MTAVHVGSDGCANAGAGIPGAPTVHLFTWRGMPITPTVNKLERGEVVRDGYAGYDRADVEKKIEALADDDPRAVAALQRLDRWMKSKGMHVRDLFSRFAARLATRTHSSRPCSALGTHFSDDEMVAMLGRLDEDRNGVIDRELDVALRARARARHVADAHREVLDQLETANLSARRGAPRGDAAYVARAICNRADGELPCRRAGGARFETPFPPGPAPRVALRSPTRGCPYAPAS